MISKGRKKAKKAPPARPAKKPTKKAPPARPAKKPTKKAPPARPAKKAPPARPVKIKPARKRLHKYPSIEEYLALIMRVSEPFATNIMGTTNADGTMDIEIYALGGTAAQLLEWEIATEGRINGDSLWIRVGIYRAIRDSDKESRNRYQRLALHTLIQWTSPTHWKRRGGALALVREWLETYSDSKGWIIHIWYDPTPDEFPWHWGDDNHGQAAG